MDVKSELIDAVYKNINAPGLVNQTLDKILEPSLQALAADSGNPFDDILMAAVYPLLEAELKRQAKKYWDLLLNPPESPNGGELVLGAPV